MTDTKLKEEAQKLEDDFKAREASLLAEVKPHLIAIAFGVGAFVGFILGHVLK